jgi:hypothetical protein
MMQAPSKAWPMPIALVAYDPDWPHVYERSLQELMAAQGEFAPRAPSPLHRRSRWPFNQDLV